MKKNKYFIIILLILVFLCNIFLIINKYDRKKRSNFKNVSIDQIIIYTCLNSRLEGAYVYYFNNGKLHVLCGDRVLDENNVPMDIYDGEHINLKVENEQTIKISNNVESDIIEMGKKYIIIKNIMFIWENCIVFMMGDVMEHI